MFHTNNIYFALAAYGARYKQSSGGANSHDRRVLSKQRGLFCRSMKESKKLMADVMAKLQERQPILILSFHDESEKSSGP